MSKFVFSISIRVGNRLYDAGILHKMRYMLRCSEYCSMVYTQDNTPHTPIKPAGTYSQQQCYFGYRSRVLLYSSSIPHLVALPVLHIIFPYRIYVHTTPSAARAYWNWYSSINQGFECRIHLSYIHILRSTAVYVYGCIGRCDELVSKKSPAYSSTLLVFDTAASYYSRWGWFWLRIIRTPLYDMIRYGTANRPAVQQ